MTVNLQIVAKHSCQRQQRIGYIVNPLDFRHHLNGIQNIIKEMGIDLLFQASQLCFFYHDLPVDADLHQLLYPAEHPVIFHSNRIDFHLLQPGNFHIQIPVLHLPHTLRKHIKIVQQTLHNTVDSFQQKGCHKNLCHQNYHNLQRHSLILLLHGGKLHEKNTRFFIPADGQQNGRMLPHTMIYLNSLCIIFLQGSKPHHIHQIIYGNITEFSLCFHA